HQIRRPTAPRRRPPGRPREPARTGTPARPLSTRTTAGARGAPTGHEDSRPVCPAFASAADRRTRRTRSGPGAGRGRRLRPPHRTTHCQRGRQPRLRAWTGCDRPRRSAPTATPRLPSVPASADPETFARNVATALFAWDTASGFMPLDYTSVVLAVGDPSGAEQAGLASDISTYLPNRDAWIELRHYATAQHLTID